MKGSSSPRGKDASSRREGLRRVDGKRSLRAILDELGLSLTSIRERLDEAFDFEVLAEGRTARL